MVRAATENDNRRHAHAAVVGHLGSAAVHRDGGHVVGGNPVDVARAGIRIVESDGVALDFARKFSQQVGFHRFELARGDNAGIAVLHEKLQNHRISGIEVSKQVLHIAIAIETVEVHRRRLGFSEKRCEEQCDDKSDLGKCIFHNAVLIFILKIGNAEISSRIAVKNQRFEAEIRSSMHQDSKDGAPT